MMDFAALNDRALTVREHYETFEKHYFGRSWTTEEVTLNFARAADDFAKLVLAHEGAKTIHEHGEKLEHELADCLWWLMILADTFEVNLEGAFGRSMNELEQALT